jgi:hypothetical protein
MYSGDSGGVLGFNREVESQEALTGPQRLVHTLIKQLPWMNANILWTSRYYTATNEDSRGD